MVVCAVSAACEDESMLDTSAIGLEDRLEERLDVTGLGEVRILVVDDHRTFAEALASRLRAEPGFGVAATTTIDGARRLIDERRPDVVLLDVDLDGRDGIRFAAEIRAGHADVRIVMVTAGEEEKRVAEAVRGVLRDETHIPPRLLTYVLSDLMAAEQERNEHETLVGALTPREREVLQCMVSGMTRASIAQHLFLSPNTVRTHMQNVLGKLGVHSTLAAVAVARRAGIGEDPR
jgi:DNA-binding NarL/FixJ family response regulator